jgi:NADH-quinone oxidoreductase subunit C
MSDLMPPKWEDAWDDPLAAALRDDFSEIIESARSFAGDLTLEVHRDAIAGICASLKERHKFTLLLDICGIDHPQRDPRFDVIYHVYSFEMNRRVRLRVRTDDATPVPSVTRVWRGANWPEREVYDIHGVRFAGHPLLKEPS